MADAWKSETYYKGKMKDLLLWNDSIEEQHVTEEPNGSL